MSAFEELLKKSVLGLGESYQAAERDLFEETNKASESVERVTDGKALLALRKGKEDPERTEYTLYVLGAHQLSQVATFSISSTGYPIKVASESGMLMLAVFDAVLENREDIKKYYDELAASPDSRLVLRIAFLSRQAQVQDGVPG